MFVFGDWAGLKWHNDIEADGNAFIDLYTTVYFSNVLISFYFKVDHLITLQLLL